MCIRDRLWSGIEKSGEDPVLLNNLAYAYLMNGQPAEARPLIDRMPDNTGNEVITTATKGLLLLWEGNYAEGTSDYEAAEKLASSLGNRALMYNVRQKKFLELAKAYIRANDVPRAKEALEAGLKVPDIKTTYRYKAELEELFIELM